MKKAGHFRIDATNATIKNLHIKDISQIHSLGKIGTEGANKQWILTQKEQHVCCCPRKNASKQCLLNETKWRKISKKKTNKTIVRFVNVRRSHSTAIFIQWFYFFPSMGWVLHVQCILYTVQLCIRIGKKYILMTKCKMRNSQNIAWIR